MTFSDLLDQLKKEYNDYAIKITSAEMGSGIISKLCIERNHHRMTREQMSKLTGIKVSRIRKNRNSTSNTYFERDCENGYGIRNEISFGRCVWKGDRQWLNG